MAEQSSNVAKIEYVPPVRTPDYITGTFSMLAVAKLILWMDAVKVEFTMDAEVEEILEGFRSAYQGELPSVKVEDGGGTEVAA